MKLFRASTTSWSPMPRYAGLLEAVSFPLQDKLTDANVEIAKVKSNYENAENALKTRNALLKLEVQSLKSDFRCQSEELSAKERILSELIEQITPNVEC